MVTGTTISSVYPPARTSSIDTVTSDNATLEMKIAKIHREKFFLIKDIFSSGDIKYDMLKFFSGPYSPSTTGKKPIVFI